MAAAVGAQVEVELEGAAELEKTIDGMQKRYLAPQGAYLFVTDLLLQNEVAIFRRLHGRFDRTGTTRRSLAEDGDGAIRRVLGTELEFGSSVWYARFLTRKISPGIGQPGGGKRTGGSAVLRLTSYRRKQIGQKLLDYLAEGDQALQATSTIAGEQ